MRLISQWLALNVNEFPLLSVSRKSGNHRIVQVIPVSPGNFFSLATNIQTSSVKQRLHEKHEELLSYLLPRWRNSIRAPRMAMGSGKMRIYYYKSTDPGGLYIMSENAEFITDCKKKFLEWLFMIYSGEIGRAQDKRSVTRQNIYYLRDLSHIQQVFNFLTYLL